MTFAETYDPWAVVAGASEGVGRELARQIAGKGVHCMLLARREAPLVELAEAIRAESGVECVAATVDLAAPDAFDREVETWVELLQRNVMTVMRCCHHFGRLMRARRHGGLLLVGSGAAFSRAPHMAVYSGSKTFDMRFAESLWVELRLFGVDVLSLVLATTDTPGAA